MRYKMMGGEEQGIHYTFFQEDVEDPQDGKKEGTAKSYGEEKDVTLNDGQSIN